MQGKLKARNKEKLRRRAASDAVGLSPQQPRRSEDRMDHVGSDHKRMSSQFDLECVAIICFVSVLSCDIYRRLMKNLSQVSDFEKDAGDEEEMKRQVSDDEDEPENSAFLLVTYRV